MGDATIYRSYFGKCDWNVGALFAHDGFVFRLYDICAKVGIAFPIKYVFGSIPCLFQGGRVSPRTATMADAKAIIEKYNSYGIGCMLTFSSVLIKKEDLQDEQCNALLSYINEGKNNGVIIASDILAKYVKENYKNLTVMASQVKPSVEVGLGNDTVEYYNKLFDLYDIVVVNPTKISDNSFLENLKYKDRVEFLVNHRCRPDCSLAGAHYKLQMELEYAKLHQKDISGLQKNLDTLMSICHSYREESPLDNALISSNDVEHLVLKGFKHFKIEGRDNNGITFIRDIGHWVYNPDGIYLSLVQSFQNGAV